MTMAKAFHTVVLHQTMNIEISVIRLVGMLKL